VKTIEELSAEVLSVTGLEFEEPDVNEWPGANRIVTWVREGLTIRHTEGANTPDGLWTVGADEDGDMRECVRHALTEAGDGDSELQIAWAEFCEEVRWRLHYLGEFASDFKICTEPLHDHGDGCPECSFKDDEPEEQASSRTVPGHCAALVFKPSPDGEGATMDMLFTADGVRTDGELVGVNALVLRAARPLMGQ
jgi:hypothetical protein